MQINIKATNIPLTEAISDFVNKRLTGLDKFLKEGEEMLVFVEVGKTTRHHKQGEYFRAEFNVEVSGKKFYTFKEEEDLYKAIDDAREQIFRKITSDKKKRKTLLRRGALRIKEAIRGVSFNNPFRRK